MALVAIIGAGPRGLSVLERLVAGLGTAAGAPAGTGAVEIVLVDPHGPGPGQVWRRDQSPLVLMNTPAGSCTIFTDPSVKIDGPIVPGPSLAEWSRDIAPDLDAVPAAIRKLAALVEDHSFAPRVLYGHYLHWAYGEIRAMAPSGVAIRHVRARAIDMRREQGMWSIELSDGATLGRVDAVVLAMGHPDGGPQPARLGADGYRISSRNATDADLSMIDRSDTVALQGFGLCAFDYIALLTEGRGGAFEAAPHGRCRYRPSGDEPRLLLGSRRGLPYRARGEQAAERYAARVLTREVTDDLARQPSLDFETDLWPLLAEELIAAWDGAPLAVADTTGVNGDARLLLERLSAPLGARRFPDHATMTEAVVAHIEADLDDARDPSSPFRQLQGAMRLARSTIREQLSLRRVSARTHGRYLAHIRDLLDFSIAGPPAHRIAQLLALYEAGIVEFAGPGMSAVPGGPGFAVSSPRVAGHVRTAQVVIDAWLPAAEDTGDELIARQAERGVFSLRSPLTDAPGLAIDPETLTVLDRRGFPVGGCHALGQVIAPQEWVPVIAPLSGTNSRFLRLTDRAARAVLDGLALSAGRQISPSKQDDLDYAD